MSIDPEQPTFLGIIGQMDDGQHSPELGRIFELINRNAADIAYHDTLLGSHDTLLLVTLAASLLANALAIVALVLAVAL